MQEVEYPLTGGNVAAQVVRVGDTVRKPSHEATATVEALLEHLELVGFRGAPRSLGRDDQGRHVLEYIPGSTVDLATPLSIPDLFRVGVLIRELHSATSRFSPPPFANWNVAIRPDTESLICHNDLAPWNLVRCGERWVFIDWDGCGPGSVIWDLAYAVQSFVPLASGGDPGHDAVRIRALIDGYGLDEEDRKRLHSVLMDRTRAMYLLLLKGSKEDRQPWARLYAEGHGRYWDEAAKYIEQNQAAWIDALR